MKKLLPLLLMLFLFVPTLPTTAQEDASICEASINIGDRLNGYIDDENWLDVYCFSGVLGQKITITMRTTSNDLDPLVGLFNLEQELIIDSTASSVADNAQISITLPATQTYLIVATRFQNDVGNTTGNYELSIASGLTSEAQFDRIIELNNLGLQANREGAFERAIAYFEEALTLTRELDNLQAEGVLLNNIGLVYQFQAEYDMALDFYQQSLEIRQLSGDREGEAVTRGNIAFIYAAQGQYNAALSLQQQLLDYWVEIQNPSQEARSLNAIGELYLRLGQYELALDFLERALLLRQQLDDRSAEAITLTNIALVYDEQGNYDAALDNYFEALQMQHAADNRREEGRILNNLGTLYARLGQHDRAFEFLQQALRVAREMSDREAESALLYNIATIYSRVGQPEAALNAFQQAVDIQAAISDPRGEANSLRGMGEIYSSQGQYDRALEFYTQALAIQQGIGDRENEVETLNAIGQAYHRQGQYDRALEFYTQALGISRAIKDNAATAIVLNNIGTTYAFQFQITTAIQYYLDAAAIRTTLLRSARTDETITQLTRLYTESHVRLAGLLIYEDNLDLALQYAEESRSVLARQALRNVTNNLIASGADTTFPTRESELRAEIASAQLLVDTLENDISATSDDIQVANRTLAALQQEYQDLIRRMQLQGGYVERELAFSVASLEEIRSVLNDNESLLILGTTELNTYALVITRTTLDGYILNASGDVVPNAVTAFNTDRRANANALQDLYTLLFAPIADEITTSNLIISPMGILNYVPFAALQNPETGRYLIEDYTISNTPSGTALVLLRDRENLSTTEAPTNGLILSQRDAPGLQSLQNADSEAEIIAANLNATGITSATESDLRNGSTGAEIIHISAHAELNRFAPLFSTIHLGADNEHDGRFEVHEIYELDLTQGTELVVLSGCETGSGGTGEDFGLLNRAFFGAGAPRVVSSLWTVDDEATAVLLTRFYENLNATDNYAAALRTAMLDTMAAYPEPYFWAPFVLTGLPE